MMELTRRRIWFAIFVLVIFSAGLATGIVLDRYFTFGGPPALGRARMGPGVLGRFGRPQPAQIVDRMQRELDLTAEQRTRLEAVFQRGSERMERFQAGTRSQFEDLRRQLDVEIAAMLTPVQRAKFEEQQKKRRVFERRPPNGGPGAPVPPR
jgi:Spy/CpxP family protein refolding chaperone